MSRSSTLVPASPHETATLAGKKVLRGCPKDAGRAESGKHVWSAAIRIKRADQ